MAQQKALTSVPGGQAQIGAFDTILNALSHIDSVSSTARSILSRDTNGVRSTPAGNVPCLPGLDIYQALSDGGNVGGDGTKPVINIYVADARTVTDPAFGHIFQINHTINGGSGARETMTVIQNIFSGQTGKFYCGLDVILNVKSGSSGNPCSINGVLTVESGASANTDGSVAEFNTDYRANGVRKGGLNIVDVVSSKGVGTVFDYAILIAAQQDGSNIGGTGYSCLIQCGGGQDANGYDLGIRGGDSKVIWLPANAAQRKIGSGILFETNNWLYAPFVTGANGPGLMFGKDAGGGEVRSEGTSNCGKVVLSNGGVRIVGNLGGDTSSAMTVGSDGPSAATNGAFIQFYGANHPTAALKGNLVLGSQAATQWQLAAGELAPVNNNGGNLGSDAKYVGSGYITNLNLKTLGVAADNSAATSAGIPVGRVYRTSTGALMVRY